MIVSFSDCSYSNKAIFKSGLFFFDSSIAEFKFWGITKLIVEFFSNKLEFDKIFYEDDTLKPQEAIKKVSDELDLEWINSPVRDIEGREKIYMMKRMLNVLLVQLKSVMETGKLATKQINKQ